MIAHLLLLLQIVDSAPAALRVNPVPQCLRALRSTVQGRRIRPEVWREHTGSITLDPSVLSQLNAQPEFRLSVWDYIAATVDDERIADGQRLMAEHRATLEDIRRRYRVDPAVLVAIWGLESNFGRGQGTLPVLRSLVTLSCAGRRQSYFRRELLAALRIVQAGHVEPARFVGSWAGAFGQTQFMPGTFEWLAVDHDGDGRKDVMGNVGDALASTGNYLRRAGWRLDSPWSIEVQLPRTAGKSFAMAREGRRIKRTFAVWASRGLTRVDGTPLVSAALGPATRAGLFAPAGADGPAFLVMTNFDVMFRYNAAESYALSVLHLADRIRGGAAFVTPWPTSDLGLSRAERRELQSILARRGHDIGPPDGILTPKTREAIKAEQRRLGVEATGRAGQSLLALLRSDGS